MTSPEISIEEHIHAMEFDIKKNDERREAIASSIEPFTIGDLLTHDMADLAHTDEFQTLVARVGWPVVEDKMTWSWPFPLASRGGDAVFRHGICDSRNPLNNFSCYFFDDPQFTVSSNASINQRIYGMHPMIHRLKLVDPTLFEMLKTTIGVEQGTVSGLEDYIVRFDKHESTGETSNPLVHLMRQAYMIMGRLYSKGDMAKLYELNGWSPPGPDEVWTDITDVLTG